MINKIKHLLFNLFIFLYLFIKKYRQYLTNTFLFLYYQ